jgi:parallel beta-helix repeat protein
LVIAMLGGVFAVDIGGCTEINNSGDYDLIANLAGANVTTTVPSYPSFQSCILITSSDVTLDCHGRSLSGGSGTSVGITIAQPEGALLTGITIKDCVVSGHGIGILAYRMSGSAFTDNNIHGCDGSGILADSSDRNTISGNRAYGNGDDGIALRSSSSNTLEDNEVYSNNEAGISIWSKPIEATANILRENDAYDNSVGIHITNDRRNELYSNKVHGNDVGIQITDSDGDQLNGDHFYGNDVDFLAENEGSGSIDITFTDVVFDSSSGSFMSYTNLSLSDSVDRDSSYSMTWISPPAMPDGYDLFRGKSIDISPIDGDVNIDEIYWQWTDAELSGYSYENISLRHHTGSDWELVSDEPDFHYMHVIDLSEFSPFALLYPGSNGTGDDGDDGTVGPNLSLSFTPGCDGNIITVISGEYPVSDATVKVDGEIAGVTGENGHIIFDGCGSNISITATKSGYNPATLTASLVDCLQCYQCMNNSDCPTTSHCSDNACVPLNCTCGYPTNHECVGYACCSDSDCIGQSCTNHTCVEANQPEPGCNSDDDCAPTEYCKIAFGASNGTCTDVLGECGHAANHTWVEYECGSEAGCMQCQPGYSCSENICVPFGITCPSTGFISDIQACNVVKQGRPCANCDYRILSPDGRRYSGKSDQSGNILFSLEVVGTYKIGLIVNGTLIQEAGIDALQKPNIQESEKPVEVTLADPPICLLLLLIVLLALAIYWRYFRKKDEEPKPEPVQEKLKGSAPKKRK